MNGDRHQSVSVPVADQIERCLPTAVLGRQVRPDVSGGREPGDRGGADRLRRRHRPAAGRRRDPRRCAPLHPGRGLAHAELTARTPPFTKGCFGWTSRRPCSPSTIRTGLVRSHRRRACSCSADGYQGAAEPENDAWACQTDPSVASSGAETGSRTPARPVTAPWRRPAWVGLGVAAALLALLSACSGGPSVPSGDRRRRRMTSRRPVVWAGPGSPGPAALRQLVRGSRASAIRSSPGRRVGGRATATIELLEPHRRARTTAYFDAPNGPANSSRCVIRSKSAMVHIGDNGRRTSRAIRSAARTGFRRRTMTMTESSGAFKPGLDFVGAGTAQQGQAAAAAGPCEQARRADGGGVDRRQSFGFR